MTDFEALIRRLDEAGVRYVVVGGFAGTVLGSPRITVDLDIVYARDGENLERLSRALEPLHPYLRGAPRDLPFRLDVPTLQRGLNFTLTTDAGDLDLLGEIVGGGDYTNVSEQASFGFDRAAAKFIRERLRPGDRVAVSAFGRITDLSTDHEEVARVIERIRAFQASIDREPDRIERIRALYAVKSRPMPDLQAAFDAVFRLPSGPGRTLPVVQREGVRNVLQPIEDALARDYWREAGRRGSSLAVQSIIESRRYRLLNLFSTFQYLKSIEGEKHFIHYGGLSVPAAESDESIARIASDARVVIHGIVHDRASVSRGVDVEARMSFRQIAELTGGSVSFAEWPDRVLTRIDESTRSTYVLAYTPSRGELDGTQRQVTVTVKRARGATVEHRRSYLAQEATMPYDSRPIIAQDRIMTAGEYGGEIDDLDLQFAATVKGKAVDIDVRTDPTHLTFEDAGGQRLAQLETATFCTDARERLVGELWQTLDLKLSSDAYAKALQDGVRHTASVAVTARPGFCKVVVYDYPSDRIGSRIVRLR